MAGPVAIENILFDADGVLQYPAVRWGLALRPALDVDDAMFEAFLNDINEAEAASLESPTGFVEQLEKKLARWNRPSLVSSTLNALHAIEVHADVMQTVQALRRGGFRCYVASNQQALRARHMTEILGYQSLFDGEFYSCFMGAAKPKREFFEKAVSSLGCDASAVLFLDDRAENVQAAQRAGLNGMVFFGTEGATALRRRLAEFGVNP